MEIVINVALPVFGIMALGYLAGRSGLLGTAAAPALNGFVYWFALPSLLFVAMARLPLETILNAPFLGAYFGGVLGTFALSILVAMLVFPDRPSILTLHGTAATFANVGYMGIPLFLTAFGADRIAPALAVTALSGVFVIGSIVLIVEMDVRAGTKLKVLLRGIAWSMVTNPLVMSASAGIAFSYAGLELLTPIENFGDILGAAAGPAALFAMGMTLVGKSIAGDLKEVGWITIVKLFIQPALTYWLAFHVIEMPLFYAQSAVILASLPTASLVFVMAQKYEIYIQRSTASVLVTTVVSVLTVSFILAALGPY
ncbi:MAG: AEC family transporter [Alphaproteobacteria bacterium]|nr:AEC family transporter [Alphaproteobacteria bacterium]